MDYGVIGLCLFHRYQISEIQVLQQHKLVGSYCAKTNETIHRDLIILKFWLRFTFLGFRKCIFPFICYWLSRNGFEIFRVYSLFSILLSREKIKNRLFRDNWQIIYEIKCI